jgi:hypothetical protein
MVNLIAGQKFALVAITRCRTDVRQEVDLGAGTIALSKIADVLDPTWRSWLGQSRTDDVERANLVLLRQANSANPGVLDEENDDLVQRVTDVWGLLQFSGIVDRQSTIWLTGSVIGSGKLNVRRVGTVRSFYTATHAQPTTATVSRLKQADAYAATWANVLASNNHKRFIRGANVLMDGLREYYGQERLHQCVRSLEAIILPQAGSTRRQFVHRCQTFTCANQEHVTLLQDMFEMRSAVEHLHESYSVLEQQFPDVTTQKSVAERRTRQVEALATHVYQRLLDQPALRAHFETDASTAAFWQRPDHERNAIWGAPFDLATVQ